MKKLISLLLVLVFISSLSSCEEQKNAYSLLSEFVIAYGAEGIIYSPQIPEGQDGYITEELVKRIYIFSGKFPDEFAILLNSHPDFGAECAVFICSDEQESSLIMEACTERIRLLGRGSDVAFIKRQGMVIFYSTMTDKKRAEELWREIIK